YNASDFIGKQVCFISNLLNSKVFEHEIVSLILSSTSRDNLQT
ncbi:hypothetical protein, partial [Campylobacter jejuni]